MTDGLNPFQANRLLITCRYIDRLLTDIENVLNPIHTKAAFPRYACDVDANLRQTLEDYIAQIRAQLVSILNEQGIAQGPPDIPASRAAHALLDAIDIAVQELRPRDMRGYGTVAHKAARDLDRIVGKLSSLIYEMNHFLSQSVSINHEAE